MPPDDYYSEDHGLYPYTKYTPYTPHRRQNRQQDSRDIPKGSMPLPPEENDHTQAILVCSSVGLAALGVIAYLVTRDVYVAVVMNGPLLAIIGVVYRRRRSKGKGL